MTEDLNRQVTEWFGRQGYALEMNVARVFEASGFWVTLGEFYDDPESGKRRELDVVAGITKIDKAAKIEIVLRFLIQCKVSKNKPWVTFKSDNQHGLALRTEKSGTDKTSNNLADQLFRIDQLPQPGFFRGWAVTGYGIKTALIDDGKSGDKDVAYQAVTSACSAYYGWVEPPRGLLGTNPDYLCAKLTFPLVVVEGALFSASLVEHEVMTKQIDMTRLHWKGAASRGGTVLDIVAATALPAYVTTVMAELELVVSACAKEPEILRTSIMERLLVRTNRQPSRMNEEA